MTCVVPSTCWCPISTAPKDRMVILTTDMRPDWRAFGFWLAHPAFGPEVGEWIIMGGQWVPTHWLDIEIPAVSEEA